MICICLIFRGPNLNIMINKPFILFFASFFMRIANHKETYLSCDLIYSCLFPCFSFWRTNLNITNIKSSWMGGEAGIGNGLGTITTQREKDQSQNAAATQPANRAWLCLLDIFTCIYDEYKKWLIPSPVIELLITPSL